MSKKRNTTTTPADEAPTAEAPSLPAGPHIIRATAVYSIAQAQAALGLRRSTIRREVREGRLRISSRAGRRYILGAWLLAWIESGELVRKGSNTRCVCDGDAPSM